MDNIFHFQPIRIVPLILLSRIVPPACIPYKLKKLSLSFFSSTFYIFFLITQIQAEQESAQRLLLRRSHLAEAEESFLSDYLAYHACPYRMAAFADREAQFLVHRYRRYQLHFHVHVVTWHYHLRAFR